MKVLRAALLLILPTVCVAQCKNPTAALKVKISAPEPNKGLLVRKLNEHGCKHGLVFEPVEEGFNYRISLSDAKKARPTFTMAGAGSAHVPIVQTVVYDDKETLLFEVERGILLSHAGAVDASAKEIVKRLIRGASTFVINDQPLAPNPSVLKCRN